MTTAEELAARAGVHGKTFRGWLRERWRAGDQRLRNHELNDPWEFDEETANSLLTDFRARSSTRSPIQGDSGRVEAAAGRQPATNVERVWDRPRDWFWEGNVQAALVAYLRQNGWTIVREANAATKERGIDIEAEREGRTLAVEVKGFPSKGYADPTRAHERKRTSPTSQARHWFAQALFTAALLRSRQEIDEVALAFPDIPRLRNLATQVAWALDRLGVPIYFVREDGSVEAT